MQLLEVLLAMLLLSLAITASSKSFITQREIGKRTELISDKLDKINFAQLYLPEIVKSDGEYLLGETRANCKHIEPLNATFAEYYLGVYSCEITTSPQNTIRLKVLAKR